MLPRAVAPVVAMLAIVLLAGCHRGCSSMRRASGGSRGGVATAAVAPRAYVADEERGEVVVVDVGVDESSAIATRRIPVGGKPRALALSGDGKRLFVARSATSRMPPRPVTATGTGAVAPAAASPGVQGVALVDVATGNVARVFNESASVVGVALSRDGTAVYGLLFTSSEAPRWFCPPELKVCVVPLPA